MTRNSVRNALADTAVVARGEASTAPLCVHSELEVSMFPSRVEPLATAGSHDMLAAEPHGNGGHDRGLTVMQNILNVLTGHPSPLTLLANDEMALGSAEARSTS